MTQRRNDGRRLRGRTIGMIAVPIAVLGGALFLGSALPSASTIASAGMGGFHGKGHFGRGHWGHGGDPGEHAELAVEWMLRWVDGTPEQQQQLTEIVNGSIEDLHGLHERHGEHRDALIAEMSKPQIDRAAIEALRQDGMSMADEASARLVEALADAAEVLTVEQRVELIELAQRFHGRRHH